MTSEEIPLEKQKRPISWKLEFGWHFWLPFFFAGIAIMYAGEGIVFGRPFPRVRRYSSPKVAGTIL